MIQWLLVRALAAALSSNNLGQVVHTHVPVTKQYNLVLANGRWRTSAGMVTACLAESNSSWVDGLKVTCKLTTCTPGSGLGPTLVIEYGRTFTFTCRKHDMFHHHSSLLDMVLTRQIEGDIKLLNRSCPVFVWIVLTLEWSAHANATTTLLGSFKSANTFYPPGVGLPRLSS